MYDVDSVFLAAVLKQVPTVFLFQNRPKELLGLILFLWKYLINIQRTTFTKYGTEYPQGVIFQN